MKLRRKRKPLLLLTVLMFMIALPVGSTHAMSFDVGKDATLEMDVQLIYGAGLRVKDQESSIIDGAANINSDDGNRNFDQWDLINSRFSTIVDADLQYKNVGVFLRGKAFYDFVYMTDNANDSPATNNNFQPPFDLTPFGRPGEFIVSATLQSNDEFHPETKDAHGRNAELLDAFFYSNFELFGMFFDFRAGDQVIQWGESLFVPGIAATQAHQDMASGFAPGAQIKERLLPSGSVSLNVDITDSLTLGGYYQYKWEGVQFVEVGSFMSRTDFVDKSGSVFLVPFGPFIVPFLKGQIDEPSDSGQHGVKLIWRAPDSWGGTEFGLYYVNYHTKLGHNLTRDAVAGTYSFEYAEDVMVYGASFSTELFDANISGEVSFQQDYPMLLADMSYGLENYVQAQVSWVYTRALPAVFDNMSFYGEVGATRVVGISEGKLGTGDTAWGGAATFSPTKYNFVIDTLDMSVPISYAFRPNGSSPVNGPFAEGAESASIGLNFTYETLYRFSFRYLDYFNAKRNPYVDRDNLSFTFTYSF